MPALIGVLQYQKQTQYRIISCPREDGPAGQGWGHWQTHCGTHKCYVAFTLVNKQPGVCLVIQAHPVFQLHLGYYWSVWKTVCSESVQISHQDSCWPDLFSGQSKEMRHRSLLVPDRPSVGISKRSIQILLYEMVSHLFSDIIEKQLLFLLLFYLL